jgi:small subunit ribosomal protein S3
VGQKVHPYGLRLGYIKTWKSRWFANKKDFGLKLEEDLKLKKHIKKNFNQAGISNIEIDRSSDKLRITIWAARPGIVIGRRGADIDRLKEELMDITKDNTEIIIDIKEVKNPRTDAQLVAENVAFQLVKRVSFRRAMKKAIYDARSAGVEGIRVTCSGRLGGAEMSRRETYKEGKIPLHTLRADIDYGFTEARTTYGAIGIKVWIYKGQIILDRGPKKEDSNKEI